VPGRILGFGHAQSVVHCNEKMEKNAMQFVQEVVACHEHKKECVIDVQTLVCRTFRVERHICYDVYVCVCFLEF
jgi:hypothetical protein